MSPAGAEQVTLQIRSMVERAWEYIAIAYQGRAHIALCYETWDEYVDDRLSDLRLTVPREQRGAVVQSLSRAQMSLRAIAKVLGVDPATVHRALAANDPAGAGDVGAPALTRGRDGKGYPRRRRRSATLCSICGEVHDGNLDECPWDLYAQGLGPRPDRQEGRPAASAEHRESVELAEIKVPSGPPEDGDDASQRANMRQVQTGMIVDSVTRAVCLVDELATLPELVDEIEDLGLTANEAGLAAPIRDLIDHLRAQAVAIASVADRLERIVAPP